MKFNEKRYDDSVKLALALGEIDDKLIEEARVPAPIFMTTKRLVTIAASLLVVIAISIAAIGLAPVLVPKKGAAENTEGGDRNNVNIMHGVGDVITLGESSIVLVDKTNGQYTFLLTLDKDLDSLDIYIYGHKIVTEGSFSLTPVVATTSPNTPEGYQRIDMPTIRVNGNVTTKIPAQKGTYTITVDTLGLKNEGYTLNSFGFSYFNVGFNYN